MTGERNLIIGLHQEERSSHTCLRQRKTRRNQRRLRCMAPSNTANRGDGGETVNGRDEWNVLNEKVVAEVVVVVVVVDVQDVVPDTATTKTKEGSTTTSTRISAG